MTRIIALCGLAVFLAVPALADIDFLGTSVMFGWEQPGAGECCTPDGWNVYVSRNGGPFTEELQVTTPEATIIGVADETIQVQVSATLGDLESEWSEASELVALRTLGPPGQIMIRCPGGEPLVEIAPGWWSCP